MQQPSPSPIRTARLNAGLSQIALCMRARVSLSTLRNAEQGLATTATINKLARALGVGFDALAGRQLAVGAAR